MAEIMTTLPTVQYGNVKVTFTPEEMGINDVSDAYELGVAAAVYLNLFSQGFKYGATLDVDAPQSPSAAPWGAAQGEVDQVIDETLKAAQILAEGLGGVTEVESVRSVEEIMSDEDVDTVAEARKIQEQEVASKAPWDAKVEAPKPKPWQSDGW